MNLWGVWILQNQHNKTEEPVGCDTGAETADGVAENGLTGELVALQAVHHGNMGAQVAAPAHTHGGKDCHVMGIGQTGSDQVFHDADGSAGSAQGGDGNSDAFRAGETEQGHQDELDLGTQPGQ